MINEKHLNLEIRKNEFLNAEPFPHLILDNFLDENIYSDICALAEDSSQDSQGRSFNTTVEEKKWISLNSTLPDVISKVVNYLNEPAWTENMRALTGIESLLSTLDGNTKLANYHIMQPGGFLGSHVDHSYEPTKGFPHVLNIIIYLTKEWDDDLGGETIFFDKNGVKVLSKISYKPNRAVIFLHTPYSFHGVGRVSKDSKLKRRTLYVDYYSKSYDPYANMKLNFDNHWFKHGTTFVLSKATDYLKYKNRFYTLNSLRYKMSRFLNWF